MKNNPARLRFDPGTGGFAAPTGARTSVRRASGVSSGLALAGLAVRSLEAESHKLPRMAWISGGDFARETCGVIHPPSQKPGSFSLDAVMENLSKGAGR